MNGLIKQFGTETVTLKEVTVILQHLEIKRGGQNYLNIRNET